MVQATQIHLGRRPHGEPTTGDFRVEQVELSSPTSHELLVRNVLMSVDPYMRVKMGDLPSYPSWAVGDALDGSAIGVVEESVTPDLPPGSVVAHRRGWRDYAVVPTAEAHRIEPEPGVPLTAHLDVLGMTGLTAYVGLTEIARLQPGEDIWVSGASGAVGAATGQLARLLGAGRVIGSAGSAAKVSQLSALGYDTGFDYHAPDLGAALREAAPDGFDVYFDNVGDAHLEAAMEVIRPHGRIVVCGVSNRYSSVADTPGPRNLINVLTKRLRVEGFTVREYMDEYDAFVKAASAWIAEGRLVSTVTVIDGLDNAVPAFREMLRGAYRGKTLVRLGSDPI